MDSLFSMSFYSGMKAPDSAMKAGHSAESLKLAFLLRNYLPACSGLGCFLPPELGAGLEQILQTLNVHIVSPDREIYSDHLNGPVLKHFTYARDFEYILEPINNALMKARQARFEHGEKPQIN